MGSKSISAWALAALLIAVVGLAGCGGEEANASTAEPADGATDSKAATAGDERSSDSPDDATGSDDEEQTEEAVPVEVAELSRGAIESVLRFSSNLETEAEVKVFSEAKRLVRRLLVEEGDRVRRGQLLLKLDDAEQRSAVAKVESQLEKAEREYVRQKRLFEQELISEQMFNDASYELDQLRIGLDDAKRELGYTEVRAPISGTVTQRLVSLGDQVQIGEHLFDLVDFDSMVARVFVPERHLPELAAGLRVRLSSQSTADRVFEARVKRVAPVVDPKSGTVKVTVDVGGQPGLRPGMYVDVDLVTATRDDAVLVPKRALVYDNDQVFVFRVTQLDEERRVERVFVVPALSDKFNILPRGGVEAGDMIVVAGQAGLKDGALVRLPGEPDPAGADAPAPAGDAQRAAL